ncbi:DUF192 domain-containing protein [Candidatus Parcubacteria bacterium]|nr:DUF192 domain-containing protein [Candidatus Parcubacteria bacterium]
MSKRYRGIGVAVIVALIAVFIGTAHKKSPQVAGFSRITLGSATFTAEIVDTEAKREQGLSGRASLANDRAMLFVFPVAGNYGIWMKDMQFAIDIVWINDQMKISDIENSVKPDTYPEIFYPSENSRYVVELSAGSVEKNKIKIGDTLKIW